MNVMSGGLSKVAGGSLERSLKKMTDNRFKGMLVGAGITIAIQSSSAMTVMLVGLVNSGIMDLGQTIGVIMGSNIGTTLTPWILSLSGIDGDGWLALLKPEYFSMAIALLGIILIMMSKKRRHQDLGKIMVGFTILMYGMVLMGDSVDSIDRDALANIMAQFASNPFLGVVVGAVVTGIIQSSAASVGILQSLAIGGGITYGAAIPIIMGQNIGTCVTALISSIGVNKNAKKVSVVHISFNLIGTIICLALFYTANGIFRFEFVNQDIDAFGISLVHTVFNVATTAMLCPFVKQLEAIANFVVRPSKKKEHYAFLDERLLAQPAMAVNEAANMTHKMAQLAQDTIWGAITLCRTYSEKEAEDILKKENELDEYEDKLGTFLVQLSGRSLTDADGRRVSMMLHTIGDLERLGDHAVNLVRTAEEIHSKQIEFSESAKNELLNLSNALREILELTIGSFNESNLETAQHVEPLEQVIDTLIAASKSAHIERLQAGKCTIQTGFVLSDILNNYSRVSDHCSNIAVALIETTQGSFGTHEYLNEVKTGGSAEFTEIYQRYASKYQITIR
ncbi:MAG: Na/Pi cotransporter family protein [Oscillospiraceae bacterium]|nr:Na/Pi cotransporter family protein [Oscillospiraceae bacterium]